MPFLISDPVDNPIQITRNKDYFYCMLAGYYGLDSCSVAGGDFDVVIVQPGITPTIRIRYTAAIVGGPEQHTLDLQVNLVHGPGFVVSWNFLVFPDATVIPNITNPGSLSVAPAQPVNFDIFIDPPGGGATVGAEDLPYWLSVDADGHISGSAPGGQGSTDVVKLTVTTATSETYKRYFILIVGNGGGGGGGTPPPLPGVGQGAGVLYDGSFIEPQIAGPPTYEIPFPVDPNRYVYKVPYWQFDDRYSSPQIGEAGPFGGVCVGDFNIKQIGGGVVEFTREFAIRPSSRNEYESFVYSYQIVLVGASGGITEVPVSTHSRIQFDYFETTDPGAIDLPKAPRAIQIANVIFLLNGWLQAWMSPTGTEVLAEDATLRVWKPGIFERKQRFIRWISYTDLTQF